MSNSVKAEHPYRPTQCDNCLDQKRARIAADEAASRACDAAAKRNDLIRRLRAALAACVVEMDRAQTCSRTCALCPKDWDNVLARARAILQEGTR